MKIDDVIQQPGQMERMQQQSVLSRLNVARVGKVVKYNATTKCVDVQILVRDIGSKEIPPVLTGVPVVFIGSFTYNILPGDECIVIFADTSVDGWWQSGSIASTVTARKHDMSDAFAFVGVHSLPNVDKGKNLENELKSVLPAVTSEDNNKVLTVLNGAWGVASSLPPVTSSDNNKVLTVVDGAWAVANSLPPVTASDNGKFLVVTNGAWAAVTVPNANGVNF